jgi:hypothetical protein
MINTSRTDFRNPIGICEAGTPIKQRIILNLVCINPELFNATARGSQKLFWDELSDHVLFLKAHCLPEDREIPDFDSFGRSL